MIAANSGIRQIKQIRQIKRVVIETTGVCYVTLRPLRYTWPISLFLQNALVEYIGACTDTS